MACGGLWWPVAACGGLQQPVVPLAACGAGAASTTFLAGRLVGRAGRAGMQGGQAYRKGRHTGRAGMQPGEAGRHQIELKLNSGGMPLNSDCTQFGLNLNSMTPHPECNLNST